MRPIILITFIFPLLSLGATEHDNNKAISGEKIKKMNVSGHIENSFTREQLGGTVTVMKQDSTVVIANRMMFPFGNPIITVEGKPDEIFIFKFESEGYEPAFKNFKMPAKGKEPFVEYEPVLLTKLRKLDEVTVTRSKVKMVMKGDTIVYNADAFELARGSMLDALISRLPGVELKDGMIMVNGEFVSELLLNGESFFKGDAKIALQNLPAFTVKNIKVYNKEHEYAYITGEAKSKKALPLVMDVNLKREYSTGWLGNIEGGYGMPGKRWMGRGFLLGFADNVRITAFGNGNNINNSTTAGTGGNWSQENRMTGDNRIIKEGIDYLFHNKKTPYRFEGNVILSHTKNNTLSETSVRNFLPDGDIWTRGRDNSTSHDFMLTSNHRITLRKTKYYALISPEFEYADVKSRALAMNAVFNSEPSESYRVSALDSVFAGIGSPSLLKKLSYRYANLSTSANRWISGGLSGTFIFNIPRTMHSIQLIVKGNYRHNHYDHLRNYDLFYPHDQEMSQKRDKNNIQKKPVSEASLFAHYNHIDFFKKGDFKISGYYTLSYLFNSNTDDNGWYDILDQASSRQAFISTVDPENSYWQRLTTNQTRATMKFNLSNLASHQSDLDMTNTFYSTNIEINDRVDIQRLNYESPVYQTVLTRASNFFYPEIELNINRSHSSRKEKEDSWSQGATNDFSLSYRYNDSKAPLSYELNYRRSPDPLNVFIPNARLKRSSEHFITLGWSNTNNSQRLINLYGYLKVNPNALVQARFYDRDTGVNTWMPDNISGNWNSYAHFKLNKPISRNRELQLSTTTYYSHFNSVDFISTSGIPEKSTVVTDQPGETLSLSWQHRRVVLSGAVTAEVRFIRSERTDFIDMNLLDIRPSFSATLPLPGELQFSTNVNVTSRHGYEDPNLRKTEVLWNAELSRSLFNGNLLFKLRAYDILGKVSPYATIVNAQAYTETFTNTLTRYVMLQVTYRFNKNPKKKDNAEITY